MPRDLTRATVTLSSRVMLPTYPLLAAAFGINYLITDRARLIATPALKVTDQIVPLPVWGALLVAVAAVLTVALLAGRRTAYLLALAVLAGIMVVFAACFAAAAIVDQGSPAGPIYPAFVALACWATFRTINAREV